MLAAGLIVLAGVAAYANSFSGVFLFDDRSGVVGNFTIRQVSAWWQPLRPPSDAAIVAGRPFLNVSFAANYALGETDVRGYHAVNLAIHILAALLLFAILRRTFTSPPLTDRLGNASLPLALAVSLLWVVHPLQTESVTYIGQRAESMVGLFYLLTLYCVIRGVASARPVWWNSLAMLACLAGTATKEVMVTAPLVVLLYDWQFLARSLKEAFRRRWALYLGLSATWALLLCLVISTGLIHQTSDVTQANWWSYARTQPEVILHYLRLSFWPRPLCLDYAWPVADSWGRILPGTMIVGGLGLATLWAWRRGSAWGFLGAWFFLILAPTSSLLPLKDLAFEHRMYLPLAAILTTVVTAGYLSLGALVASRRISWKTGTWVGVVCLLAVSIPFGMLTHQRNLDYQSELAIWEDTIAKAPNNARAYDNLGNALSSIGQFEPALNRYLKAIQIQPAYATAYYNLGNALKALGRYEEAAAQYRAAVEIQPDLAEAWNNLGSILSALGQFTPATDCYAKAIQIMPDFSDAYNNLGNAFNVLGRYDEAVVPLRQALKIRPDFTEAHYNLGIALDRIGSTAEAVAHWREAAGLPPAHPAIVNRLAWVLATHPDATIRNGNEAVQYAQRAAQLSSRRDPAVLDTLAAAYAEAGRFAEAIETAQQATGLAASQGNTGLVESLRARITLYQADKPIRDTRSSPSGTRRPGD